MKGIVAFTMFGVAACTFASQGPESSDWKTCRDELHGFSLRYPSDWLSMASEGRCIQFQRGQSEFPEGTPEIDVFLQVMAQQASFPAEYLQEDSVNQGVRYTDRQELTVNGLSVVRARFETSGPTPNWGIEYVINKEDRVLRIYISQPDPEIETVFDRVIKTIRW